MSEDLTRYGRSFGAVADAYERSRPGYPREAASWLVGMSGAHVVELGAGTGLLTQALVADGHQVIATDPSSEMLAHLPGRAAAAVPAVASAEQIPVRSRTADVVVAAQAFHWFDHEVALPEIARVLRHGGALALVWNFPDEGSPWVKKLLAIIGRGGADRDVIAPLRETDWFGWIEEKQFRTWQTVRREDLLDLARSRSTYAVLGEQARIDMLAKVAALYDSYGRGNDGMQLPYLTNCYRAIVAKHPAEAPERELPREATEDPDDLPGVPGVPGVTGAPGARPTTASSGPPRPTRPPEPPEDPGTLLIDFH